MWAGEVAQWVKHLCMPEDLNLDSQQPYNNQAWWHTLACNPGTGEAEARGSLGLPASQSTLSNELQVQCKTLSQKNKVNVLIKSSSSWYKLGSSGKGDL